jgi:hypothetical protein
MPRAVESPLPSDQICYSIVYKYTINNFPIWTRYGPRVSGIDVAPEIALHGTYTEVLHT